MLCNRSINATAIAESSPLAVAQPKDIQSQNGLPAVELINSGDTVTGTIAAPAIAKDCLLGETQYKVEFPGAPRRLIINLSGNQDVNLYVRRGSMVAIEDGKISADFISDSISRIMGISIPNFDSRLSDLQFQPGTYFIAITNCGPNAASYNLSVKIIDPPEAGIINFSGFVGDVPGFPIFSNSGVGSVAPEPGFCPIGNTQYSVRSVLAIGPCGGGGNFWSISIRADQKINVYMRKGKPVTEENGIVMYDRVTTSQEKSHSLEVFPQMNENVLVFFAIENCGFDTANYIISAGMGILDAFPPFAIINGADLMKKDLHVFGHTLSGGTVLLDGAPQETIEVSDNHLIVRKAKKKIPKRRSILITVKNDCTTSTPFAFVRR